MKQVRVASFFIINVFRFLNFMPESFWKRMWILVMTAEKDMFHIISSKSKKKRKKKFPIFNFPPPPILHSQFLILHLLLSIPYFSFPLLHHNNPISGVDIGLSYWVQSQSIMFCKSILLTNQGFHNKFKKCKI